MAKLSIDADKIKIVGEDIKDLARKYNTTINEMYTKIKNMENSGAWVSSTDRGSARKFINSTLKDQPVALALGSSMFQLGSKIIDYANNVNIISNNKL